MTIPAWWPLVDIALKASAILLMAAAITAALRRASASNRHFVWTLALVGVLALPFLSSALPSLRVPIVRVAQTPAASVASMTADAPAPDLAAPPTPRLSTRASSSIPSVLPDPATTAESWLARTDWQTLLLAIWLTGAALVLGRLALGIVAVQWMSFRTSRVIDAPWLGLARALEGDLGIQRAVTYLRSPRATMPMAWGMVSPTVLMPEDADRWPLERLRVVLLHELAHVKRRDCLTHAVAQIACAAHWFNPLAWIASRRARAERERACDDLVLAAGTDAPDYAEELLAIARAMHATRFPAIAVGATLAMAHRSQLEGRLIAILDPRIPRAGWSRVRAVGIGLIFALGLLPIAAAQPWAAAEAAGETAVRDEAVLQAPTAAAPARLQTPAPTALGGQQSGSVPAPASGSTNATPTPATAAAIAGQTAGRPVPVPAPAAVPAPPAPPAPPEPVIAEGASERKADPRAIAALTLALDDADASVRETAMSALVQMRDPSVVEPLIKALSDSNPSIRERAASGLGILSDKRAVDPLMAASKDQSADVRQQAVFALGQLRDPRAIDSLAAALKDADADVRQQAAFALGRIKDRRATTALASAIADTNPDVRQQAVFALGQLRDPSAIDGLTTALHDSKADVRQQAAFALGQIRDVRAVGPLTSALKDTDADVRQQAAFALGQLRDRAAVEGLVIALKDTTPDVRQQAAFALGQLRDPRAIEPLTAALKDASADVRQQAAFALGQIAR